MSSIIKTRTQGFRVHTFRNQEVHKYYSHLQSVMRSIDQNGAYNDLFAKPEIDAMAVGATEIEWTCSGNGKAIHISQVSESEQNRIEKTVSEAFSKIESYIAENQNKSGKNRDYAQFLAIVGKRPDRNQIWVVNGKPVIVQWGFSDDNGLMGSSGIYSDWDSFIKDIKREPEKLEEPVKIKEPIEEEKTNKTVETVAPAAAASLFAEQEKKPEKIEEPVEKTVETKPEEPKAVPAKKEENKPAVNTEEPNTEFAGLGGYVWVKWLAIILAIIILILLLLSLLVPPRLPYNPLGGNNGAISGGIGGGNGGGAGGQGGGGDNGAGGAGLGGGNPGAGGQNSDAKKGNPCKSCGGKGIDSATGKSCKSCGGTGDEVNPDEICPICSKQFKDHKAEDYKKCILQASQNKGEASMDDKLKETEEAVKKHNETLKELESEIGDKPKETNEEKAKNDSEKNTDKTSETTGEQ